MKIKVSKIYDFNIAKERQRIDGVFMADVRQRQLDIVNAFAEGNIELVITLYNNLPYNRGNNCPEQNYVCAEIAEFLSDLHCERFEKIDTILNEQHFFVPPPKINLAA